jgi:hypothetical protein
MIRGDDWIAGALGNNFIKLTISIKLASDSYMISRDLSER